MKFSERECNTGRKYKGKSLNDKILVLHKLITSATNQLISLLILRQQIPVSGKIYLTIERFSTFMMLARFPPTV